MVVRALDGPHALTREEFDVRPPGPHQVSIKVAAVGCNFFDGLITRGHYQRKPALPFSPGAEVSGEVCSAGTESGFKEGDRVLALLPFGGYASHLTVDANRVFRMAESMSFDEAAGFGIVYQTSYFTLVHRAQVQPGETVLVHAAAGGVGIAAVQIAHALGARVIGTAGSAEKLALARAHGADAAFSYRDPSWVQEVKAFTSDRGADVVIDPVGGDAFERSLKCIAFGGRIVVVGFASGTIPVVKTNRILLKNISVIGLHWGTYLDRQPELVHQTHDTLCALYAQGQLAPPISETAPLANAAMAIERLVSRKTTGKLVLHP